MLYSVLKFNYLINRFILKLTRTMEKGIPLENITHFKVEFKEKKMNDWIHFCLISFMNLKLKLIQIKAKLLIYFMTIT